MCGPKKEAQEPLRENVRHEQLSGSKNPETKSLACIPSVERITLRDSYENT